MQREQILEHALNALEKHGLAATTSLLPQLAASSEVTLPQLEALWRDSDALLYDALRYHGQQIDSWRRQVLLSELDGEQKLLARYHVLSEQVQKGRFPGCLFIAACSFYPQTDQPVHQIAEQQKQASWHFTHAILVELGLDNPTMVADQLELILEGCLSRLLVKRNVQDVATAKRLAEDVLRIALCRANGALA